MATSKVTRKKSVEDKLLESFSRHINSAAKTMTDEEFKKAEKNSNAILDRAIAARPRRRDTA